MMNKRKSDCEGSGFLSTPAGGGGGPGDPPEGFARVISAPGDYLTDALGNYIIVESVEMADILLADALAALTGTVVLGGDEWNFDSNGQINCGDVNSSNLNATADLNVTGETTCTAGLTASGFVYLPGLQTVDGVADTLWNDAGVVKVST